MRNSKPTLYRVTIFKCLINQHFEIESKSGEIKMLIYQTDMVLFTILHINFSISVSVVNVIIILVHVIVVFKVFR